MKSNTHLCITVNVLNKRPPFGMQGALMEVGALIYKDYSYPRALIWEGRLFGTGRLFRHLRYEGQK